MILNCLKIFVLCFLISCPLHGRGQGAINNIKKEYQEINQKIGTYNIKEVSDGGQSEEGGVVTGYYAGKQLRLIMSEYYGETGKTRAEYYFNDDNLIFALEQESTYDKPFTEPQSKVTTVKINRYYYDSRKLIKWINERSKEVTSANKDYLKKEISVLFEKQRLLELLK
jgi:hypothetical protein